MQVSKFLKDTMQNVQRPMAALLISVAATALFFMQGEASDQEQISRIADRAIQSPGAVAWSPDGRNIAFISDAAVIIGLENSRQKKYPH